MTYSIYNFTTTATTDKEGKFRVYSISFDDAISSLQYEDFEEFSKEEALEYLLETHKDMCKKANDLQKRIDELENN